MNAATVTTLTGTAADIIHLSIRPGLEIIGPDNPEIIISDTTITASSLNTIDAYTTDVVNAATVTTLTGTTAELNTAYTAYAAGTISGLGNEAVTITDTTIDAALLITLDAHTSGIIDASTITTLTGSDADKATVRASSGITGLPDDGGGGGGGGGNGDYTVTAATISASELISLDSQYETVIASAVTTITGTAADINTVYTANAAGTITGLGNEAVTISDTTISVSSLFTLDAYTTGVVLSLIHI